MLAQVGSSEALRELPEQDESLEERLNARVGKTQAGGALTAGCDRSVDGLQGIFAEDAVVAQPLDFDEPLIGRKPDRAQLRKIVQAFADPEVISVVDGRLGPQGSVFLVVLLDARVLVIDVQGWGDILCDHPGAKAGLGMARDPAIEESSICSGRPRSRFSRITCSKNRRPCSGRSRTWVVENSACRIEIS